MAINNLPDIFFVMKQDKEGAEIKYMNNKIFDYSLCHWELILNILPKFIFLLLTKLIIFNI